MSKQPGRSNGGGSVKPDGPMINRINDDAREDEMEENLQAVGGILSNLKAMSQDMNAELDKQNKGLDRMNLKVRKISPVLTLLCSLKWFCSASDNPLKMFQNSKLSPPNNTKHILCLFRVIPWIRGLRKPTRGQRRC